MLLIKGIYMEYHRMENKILRIGARASILAQWQAQQVLASIKKMPQALSLDLQLVKIESLGDKDSTTSLNLFPTPGVFTKALDQALLEHKIDIAVHSFKDLPTTLLPGISLGGVLPRDRYEDVLVYNHQYKSQQDSDFHVATGSVRRRAQWLHRYPTHKISDLRGNVHTRLEKLYAGTWDGIIMSLAGIERLNISGLKMEILDWMIPAPAQGVIAITMRDHDHSDWIGELLSLIHHKPTAYATHQEREFLQYLGSGCALPLGALAKQVQDKDSWLFQANVVINESLIQIHKLGTGNLGQQAFQILKRDFPYIEQQLRK